MSRVLLSLLCVSRSPWLVLVNKLFRVRVLVWLCVLMVLADQTLVNVELSLVVLLINFVVQTEHAKLQQIRQLLPILAAKTSILPVSAAMPGVRMELVEKLIVTKTIKIANLNVWNTMDVGSNILILVL